ncbi:MAG: hypothetical protein HFI42_03085 [Lachnospiraceae bacterium]|nr:hypothetical protein [Lachnospiraceae bacterium]
MKRDETNYRNRFGITGKAGIGCLVAACCFMLFCGCGAGQPAFILEEEADPGQAEHTELPREAGDSDRQESGAGSTGTGPVGGGSGSEESGAGSTGTGPVGAGEGVSGLLGSSGGDGRQQELIYVQVSGAVVKPGVYQVPAGSRVFVAVELAGGLTPEADEGSLNQAQALSDGQQVYVYALGEEYDRPGDVQAADGRVNLNTATAEELMSLPGIGQAKADSIISYRESSGGFQAIEDLMKIEGIKEGVFSKIKDRIRI